MNTNSKISINQFCGILTITLAITGALATASSTTAPVPAYIKAKIQGQSQFSCLRTNKECDNTGAINCKISIPLIDGSTALTTGRSAPPPCVPLKRPSATPLNAVLLSGDVPTEVEPYIP